MASMHMSFKIYRVLLYIAFLWTSTVRQRLAAPQGRLRNQASMKKRQL